MKRLQLGLLICFIVGSVNIIALDPTVDSDEAEEYCGTFDSVKNYVSDWRNSKKNPDEEFLQDFIETQEDEQKAD